MQHAASTTARASHPRAAEVHAGENVPWCYGRTRSACALLINAVASHHRGESPASTRACTTAIIMPPRLTQPQLTHRVCVSGASAAAGCRACADPDRPPRACERADARRGCGRCCSSITILQHREGAVALENHDLADGPQLLRLHLRAICGWIFAPCAHALRAERET